MTRLKEFGAEITSRFDHPVASTSGKGKKLILALSEVKVINQIVLQENIKKGHRVKRFHLEAYVNGHWNVIHRGTAISHKYVFVADQEIKTNKIRFTVDEQFAEPNIIDFSVHLIKDI